ncbi:hypothetical protein [Nocardioides sp.]|uniref:hypothetical protein n=1 Tax=Nocardioides sp. TaxID=35761 RepID=UPI0035629555
MPGPLDQISIIAIGYAVIVALACVYSALRWRARPPWLDSLAWMLEVLVVIRALAGLAVLAGGSRPEEFSTHLGYLIASVCIVPIALGSVPDDRGPWSVGVIGVAAVAVLVISVRMMTTL